MKQIKASVEKIQAEIHRLIQEVGQIMEALESSEKSSGKEKEKGR